MAKGRVIALLLVAAGVAFANNLHVFEMRRLQARHPEKVVHHPRNSEFTSFPVRGANSLVYDLDLFAMLGNRIRHFGPRVMFSDVYLKEHRNDPYMEGALPYNLLAATIALLGGDLESAWLLICFVTTLALYLAIYGTGRAWGLPTLVAAIVPIAVIFASHVIWNPAAFLAADGASPLKDFNRWPKVQFSFLFICAYLTLAHGVAQSPNRGRTLLLGTTLGICFYDYIYYSTSLFAATCVMTLIAIIIRRRELAAKLAVALGIAAAISLPFWIRFSGFRASPDYGFLAASKDQVFSGVELPLLAIGSLSLAALSAAVVRTSGARSAALVTSSIMVAGLGLMHAWAFGLPQMTQYHYVTTLIRPVALFYFFVLGNLMVDRILPALRSDLRPRLRWLAAAVTVVIGAACLRHGISVNLAYASNEFPRFAIHAGVHDMLKWIAKGEPPGFRDKVILTASSELNFLLALHTPAFVYVPGFHMSTAPKAERWERILIGCRIFGVSPERLVEFLSERDPVGKYWDPLRIENRQGPALEWFEKATFFMQPFHNYYYFTERNADLRHLKAGVTADELSSGAARGAYVPLAERRRLLDRYSEILAADPVELLRKYALDYVAEYDSPTAIGQRISPELKSRFELVRDDEVARLYRLKR